MSETWWVISAVVVGLVALDFWRRASRVSGTHAKQLVTDGATLVDVRTREEFSAGHLPSALNVPVSELMKRAGELGEKTKPVVLYCASGMRSAAGAATLKRLGFTHVSNLGPMSAWPK